MQQFLETEIKRREAALAEYNRTANIIGIFKVIWIVMCGITVYQVWTNHFPLKLILLLCAEIIVFILSHLYHIRELERAGHEAGLIRIAKKNISRITGGWCSFEDTGKEFIDYNHDYSSDLDIVGRNSLFQYLNSTNTYYGRQRLASDLLSPGFSNEEIRERQEAVSELGSDYAWTSQIEYLSSKIGIDASFPELISELQGQKHFIEGRPVKWLVSLSRILTITAVLLSLLTRDTLISAAAGVMMIFQLLIWSVGFSKINRYLGIMLKLPYKIARYDDMIQEIAGYNFHSEKLKQIQAVVFSAQEAIHSLSRISGNISQCQNGIVRTILNILFLWDYKNAFDLDRWKQEHGASTESWFAALGELESLISFSNLPRCLSTSCIPVISARPNIIEARGIGHPLLNNTQRVCNDLNLDNHIFIISGSNMSGKTTFMRTAGINMILANAGSCVCAQQMTFTPMNVITSMRIADELTEGISTFYAELKRIKKIIDAAKAGTCQLFLIDEIFRGTNSADRLRGAEEVIKTLCTLGTSGMITTHDLEVCKLSASFRRIVNYSFNEHYTDGEICFDYKIKNGVSKTTNAEYLLKKVGIL